MTLEGGYIVSKRILIIEDDQAIAEIERDYLQLSQFEVVLANDGAEGLKQALTGTFDLILLDVMLPTVDGFEICKKLRETLDIPILMVTAKQEDIDKIRGLGLGADDYIEKPFSPSILVARVKANLAQYDRLKKGQTENTLAEIQVGNLRIQPGSHRVFVRNQEISLKNKEYELLLFLVRNGDLVFDKETLYERIWGFDAIGDVATVPVHINRLREKIEDDPSNPHYIETVWGAGYRFKL